MYYNEPNYSKVEVTLPSESSVAYKFGMSYLPTDFAAIVTFRVRPGSKNIILKGIYNHNEDLQTTRCIRGLRNGTYYKSGRIPLPDIESFILKNRYI